MVALQSELGFLEHSVYYSVTVGRSAAPPEETCESAGQWRRPAQKRRMARDGVVIIITAARVNCSANWRSEQAGHASTAELTISLRE